MRIRRGAAALFLLAAACGGGDKTLKADATGDTSTTDQVTTTTEETTTTTQVLVTTTAKPVEVKENQCTSAPAAEPQPRRDDWATYWQTEPDANQPMTLEVCLDDVKPKVGQLITLTLIADDPDASIGEAECGVFVTWLSDHSNLCRDYIINDGKVEPTPTKEHGHFEKTYTHTYTKAQTYLVEASTASSEYTGKPHPYASSADVQLHVSVHL